MPNTRHGGMMVVLGGGSPSPSGGGDSSPATPVKTAIPIPKGFDMGGAQPGDKITVQMDCTISQDGKHLIPDAVDGSSTVDDDDDDSSGNGGGGDDSSSGGDGSTPGSRWNQMIGGGQ